MRPHEHVFTVVGRLSHYATKQELEELLRGAGAKTQKTIGARTTAVVLGRGTNAARETATRRGLVILSEHEARAMLSNGGITLSEPEADSRSLDELLGEARALFDGSTPWKAWPEAVALLDACSSDYESALADYVDAQMSALVAHHHGFWKNPYVRPDGPNPTSAHQQWHANMKLGEPRVAPIPWMTEAIRGRASPKHECARALVFTGLQMPNDDIAAVLTSPGFENVGRVVLFSDSSRHLSRAVFEALAETTSLTELHVSHVLDVHTRAFSLDQAPALRSLILDATGGYDAGALDALVASAWCADLEEIGLHPSTFEERAASLVRGLDLPASTRRYVVTSHHGLRALPSALTRGPALEEVALRATLGAVSVPDARGVVDASLERATRVLDLSGVSPKRGERFAHVEDEFRRRLLELLPTSTLCRHLDEIRLGPWFDDALAASFEAHGTHATR